MNKTTLAILISLLTALPIISQERARFFDNFDTSKGVQIVRPDFVPIAAKNKPSAHGASSVNKKGRDKKEMEKANLKNQTRSRMNVNEGLAQLDLIRPTSYTRLSMGSGANLKGFTTGNAEIDSYIVDSSRKYDIDPLLIYAQMHQESSFKVRALSHKGASGLMQLMPGTARRMGVTNIYDPKQNIEGGVRYMRMLLDMFGGDVTLALAGYNAGEGAVMKYGRNVPPYNETREYVRRISARYTSISDGSFVRSIRNVNNAQAARLEKKEARPLTIEQNAVAIRLADGRMRLVNQ